MALKKREKSQEYRGVQSMNDQDHITLQNPRVMKLGAFCVDAAAQVKNLKSNSMTSERYIIGSQQRFHDIDN